MRTFHSLRITAGFLLITGSLLAQDHWVATWAASPQSPRFAIGGGRGPAPAPANGRGGAPAGPPPPAGFNGQTVRMVVRTSIGGRRVRVQLSNTFGTAPLKIGAAHVALRDTGSAIVAGSDHALTFGGKPSFTIPATAEIISDTVDLDVPKLADLAVSVYVPDEVAAPTGHLTGLHSTYISKMGDFTGAASIAEPTVTNSWYMLSGVYVTAPADAGTIVAFGDSITDGATSTPDTDSSWPSQLARRLAANKATANVAIVNEGISGNRVLGDGAGVSALARFDRDVIAQPGVEWVVIMEGINDIGLGARNGTISAEELIAAHKQLIERAHMHGIKTVGATLTPYIGASYASDEGEAMRVALNEWMRTSKAYDAVIDFEAVTKDPQNPKQILPAFNIRDHLHPNDAGYKAMADSIDLSIFNPRKKK
jgi:lysophospholipase L1-like esterase